MDIFNELMPIFLNILGAFGATAYLWFILHGGKDNKFLYVIFFIYLSMLMPQEN